MKEQELWNGDHWSKMKVIFTQIDNVRAIWLRNHDNCSKEKVKCNSDHWSKEKVIETIKRSIHTFFLLAFWQYNSHGPKIKPTEMW